MDVLIKPLNCTLNSEMVNFMLMLHLTTIKKKLFSFSNTWHQDKTILLQGKHKVKPMLEIVSITLITKLNDSCFCSSRLCPTGQSLLSSDRHFSILVLHHLTPCSAPSLAPWASAYSDFPLASQAIPSHLPQLVLLPRPIYCPCYTISGWSQLCHSP